jgi:lipoprotein
MKTLIKLSMLLVITGILTACASEDAQQKNEAELPGSNSFVTFSGRQPKVNPQQPAKSRTTATHTYHAPAKVFWGAMDKIWVKSTNGTFLLSEVAQFRTATPIDKSHANFKLASADYGFNPEVRYTGVSASADRVTISSTQAQGAPNDFSHLGTSGDCGTATAVGGGGDYEFTLAHKASYLCLIPRSSNVFVHRSKLFKIEIVSEDNIAGTYSLASNGALTLVSGGSKTITLQTGTGFDINNTANDMPKNASYIVLAPGTHKLAIRYWLRNPTDNPSGPIEGTVTKYYSGSFLAGEIYDVTANIDITNYASDRWYMWNAQQNYWQGHESLQAKVFGQNNGGAATSSGDPRWKDETYIGANVYTPGYSLATAPNINEMFWYAHKGDPHWDADELWSVLGHLYKGGMWLKRKAQIIHDEHTNDAAIKAHAPNGIDYRTYTATHWTHEPNYAITSKRPEASKLANYFYLPTSGYYYESKILENFGVHGSFWSSSYNPWDPNCGMGMAFYSNKIYPYSTCARIAGIRVGDFY